jgi:hypothetical protein
MAIMPEFLKLISAEQTGVTECIDCYESRRIQEMRI